MIKAFLEFVGSLVVTVLIWLLIDAHLFGNKTLRLVIGVLWATIAGFWASR